MVRVQSNLRSSILKPVMDELDKEEVSTSNNLSRLFLVRFVNISSVLFPFILGAWAVKLLLLV